MTELDTLADELRLMANKLRRVLLNNGVCHMEALETLYLSMGAMREAADTIEDLRDRPQESCGQVPGQAKRENGVERESYDAGFSNGVKACLQQLDGLIHEGVDVDEIQGWIDRQWEEEL